MTFEFNPQNITLLVGLGNPGSEYTHTFHNAGIQAITNIAESEFSLSSKKTFSYAKYHGIVLIRPEVFMNNSGNAVRDAIAYFKTSASHCIIIHDDADLLLGTTKLQFGRGSAGHNGIRSIIKEIGTNEFWRFRIGIRRADEPTRRKAESFVLSHITKEDEKKITIASDHIRGLFEESVS